MTSVPQNETTDPIPISVAAIRLLARVRAYQGSYRVRYGGPQVPRLRLMEIDLDKLLESLPHEEYAHELVALPAADVEQILTMRREQQAVLKRKSHDDGDMKAAQRVVDAILARCPQANLTQSPPPAVAVGAGTDDEEEAPQGWLPYKED